ncbi:MAG: response regulator, partial [Candidatus Sumerlaeia bacterium]|nr:response regulator [Candidatus Sumerlaeia bacterium]
LTLTNSSGKEQTLYFEITVTPIYGRNHTVDKIMVLCRDVTPLKMLERALFEAQRMESIGTLAGNIAHDFNNLLAGILGYASLLKSIGRDEQTIKYATIIEDSAQRGADLVRSLMRFGRQRKTQPEPIALNQLVQKVVSLLQSAGRKQIKIKTVLDNNLEKIEGNPIDLELVLMSLGLNAIDSMSGQPSGQLTLETKNVVLDENFCRYHPEIIPGRYVYVSVSDTGRGIPKEIRDHLFEPFFTTKNYFERSGLGLAVDYAIVKNHKGYIYVYSEPGIGTIFKLYFPVLKPTAESLPIQPSLLDFDFGGKETVLFVDDDNYIRQLCREWLEKLGYTVLEASNGKDALTTFQQHQESIKAIILDMSIPELNGEQTFIELRKLNKNIPVIFTSGFSELSPSLMEKVNAEQPYGQVFFLQKPFPPEELARILRKAIQK